MSSEIGRESGQNAETNRLAHHDFLIHDHSPDFSEEETLAQDLPLRFAALLKAFLLTCIIL